MTEREALKLALEALKYPINQSHENFNVDMAELLAHRAITAIEEALAQPEQKQCDNCGEFGECCQAQPEQEPVAWIYEFYADMGHKGLAFEEQHSAYNTPLYTTPPQRKPLTDEEIILIVAECASSHQHTDIHFARAIERAHGIKELV